MDHKPSRFSRLERRAGDGTQRDGMVDGPEQRVARNDKWHGARLIVHCSDSEGVRIAGNVWIVVGTAGPRD